MNSMGDLKVVFIDGLPGTGKSSLSRGLSNRLRDDGVDAHFVSEYDVSHPLHWFEYVNGHEFLPPDLASISLSTHIQNSTDRWEQFFRGLDRNSKLQIIEGYPLLNTGGVFYWGDAKGRDLESYLAGIRKWLERSCAKIIYLETIDVRLAAERKLEFLGKRDELDEFIQRMNGIPYLRNRALSGEGAIHKLWADINGLFIDFYKDMPRKKCLAIVRDDLTKASLQRKSLSFLGY